MHRNVKAALILSGFLAVPAFADDVTFNELIGATCTFAGAVDGDLNITGTSIASDTAGSIIVTNNSPAGFHITLDAPVEGAFPGALTLATAGTSSLGTVTGDNAGDADVLTSLEVAGTSTLPISFTGGALSATAIDGSYSVIVGVNCIAN